VKHFLRNHNAFVVTCIAVEHPLTLCVSPLRPAHLCPQRYAKEISETATKLGVSEAELRASDVATKKSERLVTMIVVLFL